MYEAGDPRERLRPRAWPAALAVILAIFSTAAFSMTTMAQDKPQVIHLWERGAPGFEQKKNEPEEAKDWWVKSIHNPSVTAFFPEHPNGTAVLVAPGGGYRELVFNAEGLQAAEFLSRLGITAFALKYRLPNQEGSPYTMEHVRADAYRAMRLIRSRAAAWHLDPKRVGMLGFSAGGDLIAQIAYAPGAGDPKAPDPIDRVDGKPSFQMLVYPGGKVPDTIPGDAPPAFILVAADDEYGCDRTALELYTKLHAARVPVEAHFLARGKHAFNMGDRSKLVSVNTWPQRMADWLRDGGYLSPNGVPPGAK